MQRNARTVGLLVCVPVLLLGAVPALAWQLTDRYLAVDPISNTKPRGQAARVSEGAQVRVTGTLRTVLRPGVASPIKVRFTNPQGQPFTVVRVGIRIIRIDAPRANAWLPCTRKDFRIRQMPRRTLHLPGHEATDLAELRVPLRAWPRIKLRNRPGNQDGCKGALLTLGYRAYGARWP
jgi:hypothetical protein